MEQLPHPQQHERYIFTNDGHPQSVLLPFDEYVAHAPRPAVDRVVRHPQNGPRHYRLAEDTIDAEDIENLIAWLRKNPRLTHGELVREFEQTWARWLGTRFAVLVNSGSSANLLAYYALECSSRLKNRRIVVPAIAWATTVAPAIQLGFEPIMCEADADTFGLDPKHLESLLTHHDPAAVILVHVLGVPCKMDAIMALRSRFGFHLIEDACAALGSTYDGQRVGTFGDLSTFSFYFGHQISTIEGGIVCTDDEALHDILLQIRSHGWGQHLDPAKEAILAAAHGIIPFNRRFTFYQPGFNVRSSDLNARIGLSQMRKIDRVVARRRENHARYQERLGRDFPVQSNDHARIASISFALMAQSQEHRERIGQALTQNRIETRPLGGGSMARQPFWTSRYGVQALPFADRIHETCLHLPNHPGLALEDIDYISDTVLAVEPEA